MKTAVCCLLLLLLVPLNLPAQKQSATRKEAKDFLAMYNTLYQRLNTVSSEAQWKASTDVTPQHTGERIGADKALAAFEGDPYIITTARSLMKRKAELDPLTVRQINEVLLSAA